ncbi:MAG TPA: adenylate/guanylate cyclase domain-containing protein, partial [Bradyrhizobium sp.]|nr:adenylate/guanylate cyclase domain-containing protein [Bradyrhizobium sp.]
RFLALVLWPLGSIDRSRQLAAQGVRTAGEKRALSQANALVHKAVFDGLCGGMLQETETILALALAREHTMPLYVAAGSYLTGLAKWRAGDRMNGLEEMRRGWTSLRENDCYLCEPFWGLQVAVANAEAGQVESGLEILQQLIAWTERSGQRWLDAELHRSRAEFLLRLESPHVSMAEDALHKAMEVARTQQTRTFELRSAVALAHLYNATGRAGAIFGLLAPILADFDRGQDLPEIRTAESLLTHKSAVA